MDIAEIRKKARAQSRLDSPEPASTVAPTAAADQNLPVRQAQAATDETPVAGPLPSNEPGVTRVTSDGLDRLFEITEEFNLATDESYADSLEDHSDNQALTRRQYLAFHLGREEYALDITRISEIIKVREFTDIPRSPGFILGIISLRGVVVPVYDLRRRLNLGAAEILPTSRVIVSQQDDITVGLLVDSINQVVKLADDELEQPPGVLSGLDREMIAGIGRYQGGMIILLNLKSVLDVDLH